eukprot:CAMPEP_0170306984 /NCGR_PEP_ID=MMETSP0116_2-20130129/53897_1 /TAXON_ID=400756 /ORGANISM="Durinskia baltica, Strain CSIRO CS-38" /LENGTH=92 /DNA_ID=CAMNT_0010559097 /DNA_START=67 /DNA_END=341 /DNA_ORIENTATION=+
MSANALSATGTVARGVTAPLDEDAAARLWHREANGANIRSRGDRPCRASRNGRVGAFGSARVRQSQADDDARSAPVDVNMAVKRHRSHRTLA